MRKVSWTLLCAGVAVSTAIAGCGGTTLESADDVQADSGSTSNPPPVNGEGGSSDGGLHDATVDAKLDGSSDARVDATVDSSIPLDASEDTTSPDVAVDAPHEVDVVVVDAHTPEASVPDGGCGPIVLTDSSGIFVLGSGGSSATNCGTIELPCNTIQAGLNQAAATPGVSTVYVAPGTYSELLTLPAGIRVSGGWHVVGDSWTHDCKATDVVISTTSHDRVASASNLATTATLDTLTVENHSVATVAESLYGIVSVNSTLSLSNVILEVSSAGNGTAGTVGAVGPVTSGTCIDGGTGDPGSPKGGPGTAGATGHYSSTGFTSGTVGGTGGTGNVGSNGTAGGLGTCSDACYSQCHDVSLGPIKCSSSGPAMCCAEDGLSGCGGSAGGGGTGGTGGGSSIALFVWGGQVSLTDGSLTAGNGGNGGPAGAGGAGSAGTGGAKGAASGAFGSCESNTQPCMSVSFMLTGGTTGGVGGAGSAGGGGGGGAGGDSYAYYAGNSAVVNVNGTLLSHGSAGLAGDGGALGPAGHAATHN